MSYPEIISNIFQEELYDVAVKPIVVLPTPWQAISESEKVFLEKILTSVRLSLNHVKVISTSKPDVIQWKERPAFVISFGIDMPGLSQNEVIEIQNIKMILTPSLADLQKADKEVKTKLLNALKHMFQV